MKCKLGRNDPHTIAVSLERSAEIFFRVSRTRKDNLPPGMSKRLVTVAARARVEARRVRAGEIGVQCVVVLRSMRLQQRQLVRGDLAKCRIVELLDNDGAVTAAELALMKVAGKKVQ